MVKTNLLKFVFFEDSIILLKIEQSYYLIIHEQKKHVAVKGFDVVKEDGKGKGAKKQYPPKK